MEMRETMTQIEAGGTTQVANVREMKPLPTECLNLQLNHLFTEMSEQDLQIYQTI